MFKLSDGAVGVDLNDENLGFVNLRKSDGNTLYATKDLALAEKKFRDFKVDRSIYVVGAEQNHHFKQVFRVLELMGFENAKKCLHCSYGLVVLPEGKMSSRAGTAIPFRTLRNSLDAALRRVMEKNSGVWTEGEMTEAVRRLSVGAIRYGMLASEPPREITYEEDRWLAFEGHTGPYLFYSYSRALAVLRKVASEEAESHDPTYLKDPSELELVRFIYDFNSVVYESGEQLKPSLLCHHLFYMCKSFNRLYSELSILKEENILVKRERLALVSAFAKVLTKGLELLGMEPPERM